MDLQEKKRVLGAYETFCYRIAYYLLEREDEALHAAEHALLELARGDGFFDEPVAEQTARAQSAATRAALTTRRQSLQRQNAGAAYREAL